MLTIAFAILAPAFQDPLFAQQPVPEERGVVRSWLLPDRAVYELGDELILHLVIENSTPDAVIGRLPTAEELSVFPSDYVWVFKDGVQLPYVHPSESHAEPSMATTLGPGETLTVAVPLDRICVLPEERIGHYQVRLISDFFYPHQPAQTVHYPNRIAGAEVELEIRPPAERRSVREVVEGANWRSAAGEPPLPERVAALAEIAGQIALDPTLRARAVLALPAGELGAGFELLRQRLVVDREAIVAIGAIAALREAARGDSLAALESALDHTDLGVRRAAAKRLAGVSLDEAARWRLSVRADGTADPQLRRFLMRAAERESEDAQEGDR